MRLKQLHLRGESAWPDLSLQALDGPLNVILGGPRSGKSTAAQLATHLLYGKPASDVRRPFDQLAPTPDGELLVEGEQGEFLLRRSVGPENAARLTVVAKGQASADQHTVSKLLYGRSPRVLRSLYAIDFASGPTAARLLDASFAREFAATGHPARPDANLAAARDAGRTCTVHGRPRASGSGRNQAVIDELVRRRDAVALRIEQALRGSRQSSAVAEGQIAEVQEELARWRQRANELQSELRQVEGGLAQIETHLRYYSLESIARRRPTFDENQQQRDVQSLDQEIADCRATLQQLQTREADVRRQLAEAHPDGTADSASCLADQRASIGVLERLLDDLDAEVSQLARSHEPARCPGIESHAKIVPVADMLRQQVYTLCGQITEQQRAQRRTELLIESRQLTRAQTDLSERLEHLLSRRQTLVHEMQIAGRPIVMMPQSPVADHCQCEKHGRFIEENDAMTLARTNREARQSTAQTQRSELLRRRTELREAVEKTESNIKRLQSRRQDLQADRAALVRRTSVDQLRAQLRALEGDLQDQLRRSEDDDGGASRHGDRRVWKASDVLAELTDGQLLQLRQSRDDQPARVSDRDGRSILIESLAPAQQDQLYLALALALVSAYANRGIQLPMILDEPFLRQDPAQTAAMAGVLEQFARDGHQLVVFTEDGDAAARFESLGVDVCKLQEARDSMRAKKSGASDQELPDPPAENESSPAQQVAQRSVTTAAVRVVREGIDDHGPRLHVTGDAYPADGDEDLYFLSLEASLAEFPVLGPETETRFEAIGIRTIHELLSSDPAEVAPKLNHPHVTARVVKLWQSHMTLMCFVPGVSLDDAQVLTAVDVNDPDDLADSNAEDVAAAVAKFLQSQRGRSFSAHAERYSRRQISHWRDAAEEQLSRWREARRKYQRDQDENKAPAVASPDPPKKRQPKRPVRFLLALSSPVVNAPSIGQKAARRLAAAGVRTIADLLNADAESTTQELNVRSLTVERFVQWQAQARLVCQIPHLRGYAAQLLVACGYCDPTQIAAADPAELATCIRRYCRTSAGQRILRNGETPPASEITDWIENAAQRRPLEAA